MADCKHEHIDWLIPAKCRDCDTYLYEPQFYPSMKKWHYTPPQQPPGPSEIDGRYLISSPPKYGKALRTHERRDK
jgi:hypothetical protein